MLGSAANVQHVMYVGLGQPAEPPTETVERLEQAVKKLKSIERKLVTSTTTLASKSVDAVEPESCTCLGL